MHTLTTILFNYVILNLKCLCKLHLKLEKQFIEKTYVQRISGYVHEISVSNSCITVRFIYTNCSSHPTSELIHSLRELHDQNKFDVFCHYVLDTIN